MATLVMRPPPNTSPSSLSSGSIRSRRRVRSPSPNYAPPPLQPLPAGHPKRPLSPGSLRDVDVPTDAGSAARGRSSYPPPPTGHDLMAYFPPAAPMTNSELRPSSTYFAAQERAYFSRPGREIIRWDGKREHDHPQQQQQRRRSASVASGSAPMPPPPQSGPQKISRDMPAPPPPPHHHHPYAHAQRSPPSAHPSGPPGAFTFPPPQPPRRHSRGSSLPRGAPGAPPPPAASRSGPPPTIAIPPAQSPPGFSPHPPHMGGPPPPPQGPQPPSVYGPPGYATGGMPPPARRSIDYGVVPPSDEYDMEPVGGPGGDRGWRQPLAQAERRRAGKHTRRVIVK